MKNNSLRIVTENRPGLRDLVISILTQKNLSVHLSRAAGKFLKFSNNPHAGKDYQLWANDIDLGTGDCVKITLTDFIQQINELPDKDKEIRVMVSGGEIATILDDQVSIGCQTFSKDQICGLAEVIKDKRATNNISYVGKKLILISWSITPTISCGGMSFTEEDLNKVIAAF